MMIPIGHWDKHKHKFLQDQNPGKENIVLSWQTVVDLNKAVEHSKIRMWLDGTEHNRLIYKIQSDMPELQDLLMRWKVAKVWCTIDIVKMFWSIQTD